MSFRLSISMDEDLRHRAQAKATRLGISLAEYVRRLVVTDLCEKKAGVAALFDLGASEKRTDIARDKDKLVGEAAWAEYRRKTRKRR